jgi:hypothetical protein
MLPVRSPQRRPSVSRWRRYFRDAPFDVQVRPGPMHSLARGLVSVSLSDPLSFARIGLRPFGGERKNHGERASTGGIRYT